MESFEPFRVVGRICDDVPISATLLYGLPMLMVATGHTYQLYKGKELALVRGGPTFAQAVRSVAQCGKYRFVAEGPRVHALVHHKALWTVVHEPTTQPPVLQLLAQDELLFCLGADRRIAVRAVKTGELLQDILVERSESVTQMALLTGYTNKLLVATEEGTLHLYNFRNGRCLWYSERYPGHITDTADDALGVSQRKQTTKTMAAAGGRPALLALACSPYKDLVAYGTSSGEVVLLNVGADEVVARFAHDEAAAVTALTFRADKDHLLVSGTSLGEVVVWDLEQRCMDGVLTRSKQVRTRHDVHDHAHTAAVHSLLTFAAAEYRALLVSGGADNALLQFRFDTVDGLGLLVRERRGHVGGCTAAHFYGPDLLLTAGEDRALRATHVFSDRASWELSQGKLGKRSSAQRQSRDALRLPPATAIASSTTRNYQWASVVTLHAASAQTCGWRMDTRALEFKLAGITTSAHTARAVAMSDCGNFAVVGYSSGHVTRINVQNRSLQHFADHALDDSTTSKGGESQLRAHAASVECVEVTCGNTTAATAGLDGAIKLWDLHRGTLRASIATGQPMTHACVHQPSSLLIVAQHFRLAVYHCNPQLGLSAAELARPVRTLEGHRSPITALALAPDTHRYVVSASGDGALLLWDLAAAACVGQYRLPAPALSLSFHPDALFLATTHAGQRGAFLWVNNLRYGFVPEVIAQPAERPVESLPWMHFPVAHGASELGAEEHEADERHEQKDRADENHDDGKDDDERVEAPLFDRGSDVALQRRRHEAAQWAALDAIHVEGLRLSGLPQASWAALTVLDQIKEKNQPLLPPKKKDVPFFLPTTQELRPTFVVVAGGNGGGSARKGDEEDKSGGAHVASAKLQSETPVQRMLRQGEHDALMQHLLQLATPQAIDLELKRAVDYVEDVAYTRDELARMQACLRGLLAFVATWLRRKEQVDLVQGILADVIRSHSALLVRCGPEMAKELEQLAELQNTLRYNVDHLVSYPTCLAGTVSGSII